MKDKSRVKLLSRLISLRQKQEDQARSLLSQGLAEQATAAEKHVSEQARMQEMNAALPLRAEMHHQQTAHLHAPEARLRALVSALQADRRALRRQRQTTKGAQAAHDWASERAASLRADYVRAMHKRQAIEEIHQVQRLVLQRRQDMAQEDMAAELASQRPGGRLA